MTQEAPMFSVVIPTQGRASICNAVDSVLNQTEPSFELIVVTDGDANLTEQHLANVNDSRVRRVSQPPRGVCAARNLGVAQSRGPWITFLDDDDAARPDWLATWRSAIQSGTSVVTANLAFHEGSTTREVQCGLDPNDPSVGASRLLAGGFAVTRELFTAVGGYDEQLRHSENLDLGLRLCDQLFAGASGVTRHVDGATRHVDKVVVDVQVEPGRSRMNRYGTATGEAATRLLERHADRFAGDPAAEAAFLRIISRFRRRGLDGRAARRAALRALRLERRDLKNWKVAAAALFPRLEGPVLTLLDAFNRTRRPARVDA